MPVTRHLPYQATAFVGRVRELDEIAALLADPACRLLTLVGPGGIGKTRLAVDAAARLQDFPDGIYFIALQPVNDAENVALALATALELQLHARTVPEQQLLDYLRDKRLLLLMDNFEHVLDGATLVAEILAAAPAVKLLVTSRATLNLREEWVRSPGGLDYPESTPDEALGSYSAVQLFAERVRQVRGDFSLLAEQDAVLRICRLVDGMPLALELAAARARTLPCAVIAEEIEGSLNFLSVELRNLPERHRSMQAVFDWSWALLTETEQTAFKKLSVFRGGFTAEAGEAVTETAPTVLSALVEKSLLKVDSSGRYQFHDLLQRFAADKLDQLPEQSERMADQHCAFFADFLHQREGELGGPQIKRVVLDVESELANIRAAWSWAAERSRIENLERARLTLSTFYTVRSWNGEAETAFEAAASALRFADLDRRRLSLLGKMLVDLAFFRLRMAKFAQVIGNLNEALSIFRQIGDTKSTSHVLQELSQAYRDQGELKESYLKAQESLTLAMQTGDEQAIALSKLILAYSVSALGRYSESGRLLKEVLVVYRRHGHYHYVGHVLMNLGDLAQIQGDYAKAQPLLDEAVAVHSEIRHQSGLAQALENRGQVFHARGDFEAAQRDFQNALNIARELGLVRRISFCLLHSGFLACGMGDYALARQRFEEVIAIDTAQGELWKQARATGGLGRAFYGLGDLDAARQHLNDSLHRCRELGFQLGEAQALNSLGRVALAAGDLGEAGQDFANALRIGLEIETPPTVLASLAGVAEVKYQHGDISGALDLYALCLRHPALHADTRAQIGLLLEQMPTATASANAYSGLELTAVASEVLHALTDSESAPTPRDAEALTQREIEIVRLMADGLTNRQIAGSLHLSLNTVKWYNQQIFGKLGADNRVQVIGRARELHLLA